jgi:hypothetical protein
VTTPRFVTSVRALPGPLPQVTPAEGVTFTDEYVEGGAPGGRYLIRGVPTQTRGELHVVTGDRVTVMWKRGVPWMILNVASRKGSGHDAADEGGGVVEELIQAPLEAPGFLFPDTDVWFRNAEMIEPLNLLSLLGVPTVGFARVRGWGSQKRHFLAKSAANTLHVVKITGEPDSAQTDAPVASLVSTVNLLNSTVVLGSVRLRVPSSSIDITTSVQLGTLLSTGYNVGPNLEHIEGRVEDAYINGANEVVITVAVTIRMDPNFILVGPRWVYPVVLNVTTGQFILNGLTTHSGLPAPAGVVLDGADFNRDTWATSDFSLNYGVRPLLNSDGDVANAIVGLSYFSVSGAKHFTALLTGLGGGPDQTIVPFRSGGGDRVWLMSADQRYALWVHLVLASAATTDPLDDFPPFGAATYDPVHMTDFVTFQDVEVAADVPAFLLYKPVMLSPSLLFALNSEPNDPDQTDVATEFAEFRSAGGEITLDQTVVEVAGSEEASALKPYSEVPAATFIPQYLADFVADPAVPTDLGFLLGFLKYQTIEDDDSGFDFPQP